MPTASGFLCGPYDASGRDCFTQAQEDEAAMLFYIYGPESGGPGEQFFEGFTDPQDSQNGCYLATYAAFKAFGDDETLTGYVNWILHAGDIANITDWGAAAAYALVSETSWLQNLSSTEQAQVESWEQPWAQIGASAQWGLIADGNGSTIGSGCQIR
jgi:hypothetical protein